MENVRAELGYGTPIDMNNTAVRTLLQARYGGPSSLGNGYGRALVYTFDVNQFSSPRAYEAYTPTVNLRNYFSSGQLQPGSQFAMTAQLWDGSWICSANEYVTTTFTYGVAGSAGSAGCGRKSQYQDRYYDGGDGVYARKIYIGDSTSFPDCRVSIVKLELIL